MLLNKIKKKHVALMNNFSILVVERPFRLIKNELRPLSMLSANKQLEDNTEI